MTHAAMLTACLVSALALTACGHPGKNSQTQVAVKHQRNIEGEPMETQNQSVELQDVDVSCIDIENYEDTSLTPTILFQNDRGEIYQCDNTEGHQNQLYNVLTYKSREWRHFNSFEAALESIGGSLE